MKLIQKIKNRIFQWKYKKGKFISFKDIMKENPTWEIFWELFSYTMWKFRQLILDPTFELLKERTEAGSE